MSPADDQSGRPAQSEAANDSLTAPIAGSSAAFGAAVKAHASAIAQGATNAGCAIAVELIELLLPYLIKIVSIWCSAEDTKFAAIAAYNASTDSFDPQFIQDNRKKTYRAAKMAHGRRWAIQQSVVDLDAITIAAARRAMNESAQCVANCFASVASIPDVHVSGGSDEP